MKFKKIKLTKKQIIIIAIILVILITGIIVAVVLLNHKETPVIKKKTKTETVEKVNIVDVESNSRPYAVMINNINVARTVQSGLNKAYIVYEMIVEGGITRYLALFRDADVAKIGSIRSARHYYLDYVMENDAIFIHWGYSPQALEDMSFYGIDRITDNMNYFYRDTSLNVASEHTLFTTSDMLDQAVEDKGMRSTTDTGLLLDYSAKSIDFSKYGTTTDATKVDLTYSNYISDSYVYNEETKTYDRSVNGTAQIDQNDGKQISVKNIIVYQVENHTISGDEKGRQELSNIGSGKGYLISEGKAISINWYKPYRDTRTEYTFDNGEKIKVNDGNTFIQIVPTAGNVSME